MKLSYAQWFALLTMKHFGAESAGRIVRYQTLTSLVRRGFAARLKDGAFEITNSGLAAEDRWPE